MSLRLGKINYSSFQLRLSVNMLLHNMHIKEMKYKSVSCLVNDNTGVLERTRRRRVRSLGRTLIDKASLQNVSVTLIRALWINEAENKIVVVRNVL